MPTLYIIAGPNGVGKTTFADRYLPDEAEQLEFVNADLIARGLSPYDPDSVSIEAGKITLKRIKELIAHKTSFTWETTMSGRTAVGWLREAQDAGYVLKTYFLWVREPEITIARIKQRVVEGGHNIEEDVSRRRFYKTIQNFFAIYAPLMNTWKIYENDLDRPRLLAVGKDGRRAIRDRIGFAKALKAAKIEL
jgi:predicted ABC-type ATPase